MWVREHPDANWLLKQAPKINGTVAQLVETGQRRWKEKTTAVFSRLSISAGSSRSVQSSILEDFTAKQLRKAKNLSVKEGTKMDDTQTLYFDVAMQDADTDVSFLPRQLAVGFRLLGDGPLGVLEEQVVYFAPTAAPEAGATLTLPLSSRKFLQAVDGEYEISVLVVW